MRIIHACMQPEMCQWDTDDPIYTYLNLILSIKGIQLFFSKYISVKVKCPDLVILLLICNTKNTHTHTQYKQLQIHTAPSFAVGAQKPNLTVKFVSRNVLSSRLHWKARSPGKLRWSVRLPVGILIPDINLISDSICWNKVKNNIKST